MVLLNVDSAFCKYVRLIYINCNCNYLANIYVNSCWFNHWISYGVPVTLIRCFEHLKKGERKHSFQYSFTIRFIEKRSSKERPTQLVGSTEKKTNRSWTTYTEAYTQSTQFHFVCFVISIFAFQIKEWTTLLMCAKENNNKSHKSLQNNDNKPFKKIENFFKSSDLFKIQNNIQNYGRKLKLKIFFFGYINK